jgi:DNA-binding IscR family transcriptional regulator
VVVGPSDALAAALAVARPYLAGQPPAGFEDVVTTLGLPRDSVQGLLDRLAAAGLVCTVRSGPQTRYLPMRAPARLPVLDVLAVVDPRQAPGAARETDAAVGAAVQRVQSLSSTALAGLTLADLLAGSAGPARVAQSAPSVSEPRA